jgi:hypothetical protein
MCNSLRVLPSLQAGVGAELIDSVPESFLERVCCGVFFRRSDPEHGSRRLQQSCGWASLHGLYFRGTWVGGLAVTIEPGRLQACGIARIGHRILAHRPTRRTVYSSDAKAS